MEAPKPITISSLSNIINFKEFYNFGEYYIKLCYNDNGELIIICYNIEKLDGIRYEITMNIQELYNKSRIFRQYTNIQDIYELIIDLIKDEKCNIQINPENKLTFCFKITDIKSNIQNVELILRNNDNNNTKEYINILSNEIKNLRKNNNMEEIKELKQEIKNIKDILLKYEINKKIDNETKQNNGKKCLYCGREDNLKKCICCHKIICNICILNNKNIQCQKECFLFDNNSNILTSYYHISKYPLPKNFESKIHFKKVAMIRAGITFDPSIIKEKKYNLDSPNYNIYYKNQNSKSFYTNNKGWFEYFKLDKCFKEEDDLIITVKDGKLGYLLNGSSMGDSYPIEKEDVNKKDMYLLIHRRNMNSQCELKYIYETLD